MTSIHSSYLHHVQSLLPETIASKIEGMTPSRIRDFLYFGTEDSPEIHCARLEASKTFPKAWKWYVKKNCSSVAKGTYGINPNETFGTECHKGVLSMLKKMKTDKKPSFNKAYQELAALRQNVAIESHSINADSFGKPRGDNGLAYTAITDGIGHYHKKCLDKFMAAIKGKTPETKHILFLPEDTSGFKVYNLNPPEKAPVYIVTYTDEKSGSEELALFISIIHTYIGETRKSRTLNRIVFSPDGEYIQILNSFSYSERWYLLNILQRAKNDTNSNVESVICHCPADNLPAITGVMDSLYEEILAAPEHNCSHQILNKIARFHYLLANSMQTSRGNAAISEMQITALLLYHGFCPSPYKEGISADMEALTSTEEEFINNYSTFRKIPLVASPIERGIIRTFGYYKEFAKIPEFAFDVKKHLGWTDYLTIRFEEVPHKVMRGVDNSHRAFVLIKKEENKKLHILFQRYTRSPLWLHHVGSLVDGNIPYPLLKS